MKQSLKLVREHGHFAEEPCHRRPFSVTAHALGFALSFGMTRWILFGGLPMSLDAVRREGFSKLRRVILVGTVMRKQQSSSEQNHSFDSGILNLQSPV